MKKLQKRQVNEKQGEQKKQGKSHKWKKNEQDLTKKASSPKEEALRGEVGRRKRIKQLENDPLSNRERFTPQ